MTELEKLQTKGADLFRGILIGKEISANGKAKPKYRFANFKDTVGYGQIEESKWVELTWKAVEEAGLTDLYDAIRKHMETHIYFLHKEENKKEYALRCLVDKAYEHWSDFEYPSQEQQIIIWL